MMAVTDNAMVSAYEKGRNEERAAIGVRQCALDKALELLPDTTDAQAIVEAARTFESYLCDTYTGST